MFLLYFEGDLPRTYEVLVDELCLDVIKIKGIKEWDIPSSKSQVHSFHGLACFYLRFIKKFSTIKAIFTDLMKFNDFLWTDEAEDIFIPIRKCLIEAL